MSRAFVPFFSGSANVCVTTTGHRPLMLMALCGCVLKHGTPETISGVGAGNTGYKDLLREDCTEGSPFDRWTPKRA